MSLWQTLAIWSKVMCRDRGSIPTDLSVLQQLELMPVALLYYVDGLEDFLHQIFTVKMRSTPWLKCWSTEHQCNKHLLCMPFDGERCFGESLDSFIREVTGKKSTVAPEKESKTSIGKPSIWEVKKSSISCF